MSGQRNRRRGVAAVLIAGLLATLFVAGTYAAPLLSSLTGRLLTWAYAPLCHQIAERSIPIGAGVQAVCARCAGLYLGGAVGLLLAAGCLGLLKRRLRPAILGLALAPTLIDALLPWLGFSGLSNVPRLVLALPAGLVAGLFLAIGIADLCARGNTTKTIPVESRGNTLEVCDG